MTRGRRGPDWSEQEFSRLGEIILETISGGGTLDDACRAFEEETSHLRTYAANRYKAATIVLPKIRDEYEAAKIEGAQKRIEQRKQEGPSRPQRTGPRVQAMLDGDEPVKMTKRDLIRFIRTVDIVDEDAEHLRAQNEAQQEEIENLTAELNALRKEHEEMKQEHDTLLQAFSIARKAVTSTPGKAEIKVGADGVVQSVTPRD